MDGKWKYFFYFSGHNKNLNTKTLGVAVADNPTGPFKASAKPIVSTTKGGQMIDSDVFTDPESGQTYFYYGNGQMHYRLLSDDMMSTVGDEYTLTPSGGSLADYAYREGTYVFYRNGIYYFLWSVDDTGAANYHWPMAPPSRPPVPSKWRPTPSSSFRIPVSRSMAQATTQWSTCPAPTIGTSCTTASTRATSTTVPVCTVRCVWIS